MRHTLATIALLTLLVGGCGSDSDSETTAEATTTIPVPSDDEHDDEGEGRDPDALFGKDVCVALLQALEGNVDDLDRYADEAVLDALSSDPFHGKSDEVTVTSDGETCTMELFGGDGYVLTLLGDGHVGQRAVAVDRFDSVEGTGGAADGALDAAVADRRAAGATCEGDDRADGHELLAVDGGDIVSVQCDQAAYQGVYELWAWDGVSLAPLQVEQWADGGLIESSVVVGFPYVEDGQLENVSKARGVGDCGTYQRWFLDGDVLGLAAAYHQECSDSGEPVGPDDWPQVYPSGD